MNIQLSISLLVSDRTESLKKCLDSLTGILRELPCELIAVFTGRKEETLEIIKQYTDHIIPFEWRNDFSAARNAGLKEAKGEWFMFIDDDEWFENIQELIRFFKSNEYRKFHSAVYIVRNYTDWSGNTYEDTLPIRLARRMEDLCFQGSIHEQLETSIGLSPVKYLNDYVHHYGYVAKKAGTANNRAKRNIPLLLRAIEEEPQNAKHYMQLAQEYRNERNYKKAEEYTRKGLEISQVSNQIYTFECWMRVHFPIFIEKQGKQLQALEVAENLAKEVRSDELVKLYLYRNIAQIAVQLEENEKVVEAVEHFGILLKQVELHSEQYLYQASAGLTLDDIKSTAYVVYVNGLIAATNLKDARLILNFLNMIPWDLGQNMIERYYASLEMWKKNKLEQKETILEAFSKINSKNPYILCQKMLFAECQKDYTKMRELYKKCCSCKNQYIRNDLIKTALVYDLELVSLLDKISLEQWNLLVSEILREISLDEEEKIEKIRRTLIKYSLYNPVFQQQLIIKNIQEKVLEGEELMEAIEEFCQISLKHSRMVYNENMFERENIHSLSIVTQFALGMQEILDFIQKQDDTSAIRKLRELLELIPQFRMIIKRVLDYVVKKNENNMTEGNQEFHTLGLQIKQSVREMLEHGEYQTAAPIVQQLCTLLPNDLEVLRMKQQIIRKFNE